MVQKINMKLKIKDKIEFIGGIAESFFCLTLMFVIGFGIDRSIPFATKDYLAIGYIYFGLGAAFLAGLYLIYDSIKA